MRHTSTLVALVAVLTPAMAADDSAVRLRMSTGLQHQKAAPAAPRPAELVPAVYRVAVPLRLANALPTETAAPAGPRTTDDLLEIYREAQAQDAAYQSARAQLEAARERAPQALAGLLPQVGLSGTYQYNSNRGDAGDAGFDRGFDSRNATLSASQPLFRRQNSIAYDQAKLSVEAAEAQFGTVSQDLMVRVSQAYFDVLLADIDVAVADSLKAAISQQLEQAKRNFEVGTATITDTYEAQARYDLAVAQGIRAEADREVRRRALQQIIGRLPGRLRMVGEQLPLAPPEPNEMERWAEQALATSQQVLAAQKAAEIAVQEVERARAGHLPTLDAVASYGYVNPLSTTPGVAGLAGGHSWNGVVGVQLNVPIFQGGAVDSRVREALANRERAAQDLEQAKRNVALAARQAYLGVTAGLAQVTALRQAVKSTESQLEATKLGMEVGVRTQVDVLNAEQQLASARRDLANAGYVYLISHLKLKAAAGTLAEPDLERLNRLLR